MMKFRISFRSALLLILVLHSCKNPFVDISPATQPYQYLKATQTGREVPESPDPLVAWRWPAPTASDNLEIYTLKPVSVSTDMPGSFSNLNSLTGKSPEVSIMGTGSIMMDFGQVNAAWLEFDSEDFSGSVEMSISEYNEPAILNKGAQNRIKTLAPVKYGNSYRLELNEELFEGVRYGWIHVRSFESPWHISNVRLVCQVKPVNYNGNFSCSDPELTRIWYTGAYGVKLNLLNDYFGAILMERSDRFSWTGDAYTSQAASLVAFGNFDFVLTNIHHTADQNNGIQSYSMYWIQSLVDYFNYTGDTATIVSYLDNAEQKLDLAYRHYGTDPKLTFYGWDERIGAGFEDHSCRESQNAYRMLCIESWIDYASIMNSIGRKDLGERYEKYAREKIDELRQDPGWHKDFGIHAASDAINAGFTVPDEQKSMFNNVFSDRLNRLSYSPFNQYFVIQALARMGNYDEAIGTIRDCWGGQLEYGATTFFVAFRPSWNHVLGYNDAPPNNQCGYTSLAHPWGGGVVKWLSEEILGIKPASPGFRTVDIVPHLGRTLTSVKGAVPTPHGIIQAEFDVSGGFARVDIPAGVKARVGIPKAERKIQSIHLNDKLVWENTARTADTRLEIMESEHYIFFPGMEAGDLRFTIEYIGDTPEYIESDWVYPAVFAGEDTTTHGNWGGVYGSEGYILCAYQEREGEFTDLQVLPEYVSNVSYNLQKSVQWASGIEDERAASAGPGNGYPRNAGAIHTQDPLATLQTMTVDIELKGEDEHEFSLYFVDWNDSGRRTAVEMFDLETRRLIAPIRIVRDYTEGKYLTYRYHRPVRFRINHVRGPNAVLNGIFFDEPDNTYKSP